MKNTQPLIALYKHSDKALAVWNKLFINSDVQVEANKDRTSFSFMSSISTADGNTVYLRKRLAAVFGVDIKEIPLEVYNDKESIPVVVSINDNPLSKSPYMDSSEWLSANLVKGAWIDGAVTMVTLTPKRLVLTMNAGQWSEFTTKDEAANVIAMNKINAENDLK